MTQIAAFEGPRIVVRGARTHNLKGVDVDLPRGRLVVVTGPSGSGKSSLAFDTLFAEGHRRYVQCLSAVARQHLTSLPRPEVDLIEGLSPTLAVAPSARSMDPLATVGTETEILDYLRLLFVHAGQVVSEHTGEPIERHTVSDMVDAVMALQEGTKLSISAPVVRGARGDLEPLLGQLRARGFVKVVVDGRPVDLSEDVHLEPDGRHDLDVRVDRIKVRPQARSRVADSLQTAVELADGRAEVHLESGAVLRFSERYLDAGADTEVPPLTPSLFSFRSVHGQCSRCHGSGRVREFDPRRIVPDPDLEMPDAVHPWRGRGGDSMRNEWPRWAEILGVRADVRWSELSDEQRITLFEGDGTTSSGSGILGIRRWLERRGEPSLEGEAASSALQSERTCVECGGSRLGPHGRRVRVRDRTLPELCGMTLGDLTHWTDGLTLPGAVGEVARAVLEHVRRRLGFLVDVGLPYLQLDRDLDTLSGGEAQRVRLATQVGAGLSGVTYVLDEPSAGLHPSDQERLLAILRRLRDLGNTLVVVEHDLATVRAADWVVDMGPGAGIRGGAVVAAGPPEFVAGCVSPTAPFLGRSDPTVAEPWVARGPASSDLRIRGARGHNLHDVTVSIPCRRLTAVVGVSGSGKSSLIVETLLPEAARRLQRAATVALEHDGIDGLDQFDKVVAVDQTPIGRSARSTPATYCGIWDDVRELFAELPAARMRGWGSSRFSFNVKGGRCESCRGDGIRKIDLQFLPDMFVPCDACRGRRYNPETLDIELRGRTIADVLEMSVHDACGFFAAQAGLRFKLEVLRDIGLGYLPLGQTAVSLSGGEAQRIKLGRHLARKAVGHNLFILDEPTCGLHATDVAVLVGVLQRLVDEGNTVVVIEHDLQLIRAADHVVELGPRGGEGGGRVVDQGTPLELARAPKGPTGRALSADGLTPTR